MTILKHLQKKKKDNSGSRKGRKDYKSESLTSLDTFNVSGEYFRTGSVDSSLVTSTPVRLGGGKTCIILQEISYLKIYEDFDELDNFDISAVTPYGEVGERLKESGFKIYEHIGESFAVD